MRVLGKIVVAAAAVCAFSGGAFAQVRTFGPAAPYLVTGRSVSVPPYGRHDQQPYDESGARHMDSTTDPASARQPGDEPAPR